MNIKPLTTYQYIQQKLICGNFSFFSSSNQYLVVYALFLFFMICGYITSTRCMTMTMVNRHNFSHLLIHLVAWLISWNWLVICERNAKKVIITCSSNIYKKCLSRYLVLFGLILIRWISISSIAWDSIQIYSYFISFALKMTRKYHFVCEIALNPALNIFYLPVAFNWL